MTEILRKVIAAHAVSHVLPRRDRTELAIELGEYGVLSKRQVAGILNLHPVEVGALFDKTNVTGGKLNPDSIPMLAEAMDLEGAARIDKLCDVYDMGTSVNTIIQLTGESRNKLWRRIADRRDES